MDSNEIELRLERLEKLAECFDMEREKLTLSMSELAYGTKANLAINENSLKAVEGSLDALKKQNRYLMAVLGAVVMNGGPALIQSIAKMLLAMHTGQ